MHFCDSDFIAAVLFTVNESYFVLTHKYTHTLSHVLTTFIDAIYIDTKGIYVIIVK